MKQFFVDVETTGLSYYQDSIIEVSYILCIDYQEMERRQIFVQPRPGVKMNSMAQKAHGVSYEEAMERGVPEKVAYDQLRQALSRYCDKFNPADKYFFMAYNSPFDNQFLRAMWKEMGDRFFGSYFWAPDICIMRHALAYMMERRGRMTNFQQLTVAQELGIELDKDRLHEAMYDIEASQKIWNIVRPRTVVEEQCV